MTITILEPVEAPTEPTPDLNISDKETCYLCQSEKVASECHYCERPICGYHQIRLPQWCAYHLDACPKCHARKQKEN